MKFILKIKPISTLIGLVTFFHLKQSLFVNSKYVKNNKKNFHCDKHHNLEINENCWLLIYNDNLKTDYQNFSKFQVCTVLTDSEKTVKEAYGQARLGRAGLSWFNTDIDYMEKKWFRNYIKKSIVSEMSRCLKIPYDCGEKLSTENSQ